MDSVDLSETKSNDGESSDCESSDSECAGDIIDNNSKCDRCDRYILEENQLDWDFDRLFSGCCYNEIITWPGESQSICEKCEENEIDFNDPDYVCTDPQDIYDRSEVCERCDRYIIKNYQMHWDFDKIFSGRCWNEIITTEGVEDELCGKCDDSKDFVYSE